MVKTKSYKERSANILQKLNLVKFSDIPDTEKRSVTLTLTLYFSSLIPLKDAIITLFSKNLNGIPPIHQSIVYVGKSLHTSYIYVW